MMTCGTPDDLQFEFPFYSESRPGFINNFIASSLIKFLYLHIKCEALIARLSALSKSIRQNSDRKMNTLIRLTLPNNLNLSRNGTFEFYPEYNYQVAFIHYLSCITFKFSLGHIFQWNYDICCWNKVHTLIVISFELNMKNKKISSTQTQGSIQNRNLFQFDRTSLNHLVDIQKDRFEIIKKYPTVLITQTLFNSFQSSHKHWILICSSSDEERQTN